MVKKSRFPGIFFGWWIVLASGILTLWGNGFGNFGFAPLFKPIASELGFSRAATSVAPSVAQVERGFLSPISGWISDRFGPRGMVLVGIVIIGLSLMLMKFVNSLWTFYLVWGVLLGAGANIGLTVPLDKTVTNWFVRKRGRALSIKFIFNASGSILMVPLIAWLISEQGWRNTCFIGGVVMLVMGLPIAWFFIKQNRPEYYGLLPDGVAIEKTEKITQTIDRGIKYAADAQEVEFTLRQAIKTPAFWLVTVAVAGFNMVGSVFVIHGVPFLSDMGIDPVKAAIMVGLMSAGVIPGAFISMFTADRIKKELMRFLVVGAYTIHIIALVVFLLNPILSIAYPLFFIHHFVAGIHGSLTTIIMARYFGRKAFGSIRGISIMCLLPALVASPIYAGWVFDTTGSYITVFLLCGVAVTVSMFAMLLAVPSKPPAHISDIHKIF
ncbi:MAG: MFS transporter [Chloroflexota bacterium]